MHIVIFGLTVSSSWGNGHATLWRSLIGALVRRGHRVVFYERDVPFYAGARDLFELPEGASLRLYASMGDIAREAREELAQTDLALCTSFCPDGALAAQWIVDSRAKVRAFYDMDTPVTLSALGSDATSAYLPTHGLRDFDLVLSYTGGRALEELETRLGARRVAPLYGWVDPQQHFPVEPVERFRSLLSYLGTYAQDRQPALEELFLEPAARLRQNRFLIGGAQYPQDFPWSENVYFTQHLEPAQHPAFFCSSRATLNITRKAMAEYGYCPSGRLFEAAACGAPILTDWWDGLDTFFDPDDHLSSVRTADDVVQALQQSDRELQRKARNAREHVLARHTAQTRAVQLERLCDAVHAGEPEPAEVAA